MEDGLFNQNAGGPAVVTAAAAWRNLSLLADCTDGEATGKRIAASLSREGRGTQSSLAIRNVLHEILVDTRSDPDPDSVVTGVSELFLALEPKVLTAVMRAEVDPDRRTAFLLAAVERLPVDTLVRLTASIAEAFERPCPPPIRSLIQQLARRALTLPPPANAEADTLLRGELESLYRSWTAARGSQATRADAVRATPQRASGRAAPEADRILEMAIECDALGDSVWAALQEVVGEGGLASMIDRIKLAPEDSKTAAAFMKRVGTPQELRRLLTTEPFDGAAVDALLRGLGISAAKVMLEELVESTRRLTRRSLMERLARLGPEIRPLVEGRLKDQRWFVQRNMIALLRSAKCPADPKTVSRFLGHKDARVRREVALWGLENPATRDEALAKALADPDTAVLRPSLQSARTGLPAVAVPALARRLLDTDFPPEFRVLSINLLSRSGSVLALEALLHFAQNGTTMFGKPRLAAKSPEMLASLSGIARSWPTERRVAALLAQARKMKDAEIVAALRAAEGASAA